MKVKVITFSILLGLSSCATIFIPKKQKITIETGNENSEIYVDKVELGKGKTINTKIEKSGVQPVIIKTAGYLDENTVLIPNKLVPAAYPLMFLDCLPVFTGMLIDGMFYEKFRTYDKVQNMESKYLIPVRTDKEKNLDLTNVSLVIEDKNTDVKKIYLKHKADLEMAMLNAEKDGDAEAAEVKAKLEKKGKKNNVLDEEKKINYNDTKLSTKLYENLRKNGYIDTVNKIFQDEYNSALLEAKITKIKYYTIQTPLKNTYYYKMNLEITWFLKNAYNEILDSINTNELSGEYTENPLYNAESLEMMAQETVDRSYVNLHSNETFKKHIAFQEPYVFIGSMLKINKPKSIVKSVEESTSASVIVKRKDNGHGSGFAISNDGYILTNYHVISSKYENKFDNIEVVLNDGTTLKAEIVRYNKSKDIALLKVNHNFETAFSLPTEKTYKNLMEVYTIGAPKSIELGQSVSIGLLSNERNANNNNLLQLSMGINPGNSGGPLFDKTGVLHGVIRSKLIGFATEGVGFAIPAYKIKEYLNIAY